MTGVNLAKKKKVEDKEQKTLFSFVDETKPKKKVVKEKPKKEEIKKKVEVKPEKLKIKSIGTEQLKHIPEKLFFKGNDTPFGLKEGEIKLKPIKGESYAQKYLRFLIENGKIIQNLEEGLLLDVYYDGGQN